TSMFSTPGSWWGDGANSLRFVHVYSNGYRIDRASVQFSGDDFPVDLFDGASVPAERTVTLLAAKPTDATSATLTLEVFDADFPDEGELYVNGHGPITLFGDQLGGDELTASAAYATPAAWWLDGSNSLRFVHLRTAGFRIDRAGISFTSETASPRLLSDPW